MLNELYALQRGLEAAGMEVSPRHADLSSPGRADALQVRLDATGSPVELTALARDRVAGLWTLRNGKHNSFPYLQLKRPLLAVPDDAAWRTAHAETWRSLALAARRRYLRDLARDHRLASGACGPLASKGLHDSLKQRRASLHGLQEPNAAVPAVVNRALLIHDEHTFSTVLLTLLLDTLDHEDDGFVELARTLLTGRIVQSKLTGCPLWVDVKDGEFARNVADPRHAGVISHALSCGEGASATRGVCLLSGAEASLHEGAFPQPTVPVLGQLYLFSKNSGIPAAYRYQRADVDGLPIDSALPQLLAGGLDVITRIEHKGKSWRDVPSEKPKARDLLIACVDSLPAAPVAELIAGNEADQELDPSEEDVEQLSEQERAATAAGAARAIYLARAERVVEAVKGKVGTNIRQTPVSVLVLRKVDTGNAKAILHRALTVGQLYEAALGWSAALDNLPPWLEMTVPRQKRAFRRKPPALAPLQLPQTTRAMFIRGGSERAGREPVGLSANDALTLFLDESGAGAIARTALRVVLDRQSGLLSGSIQAWRRDRTKDGLKASHDFDRDAALRTAAMLGLLLAKIGRSKEEYMSSPAFQLGQVLAAADVIHAGYCADVRKGQTPPTLLGNSMLAIAADNPARALTMLLRRWAPYSAWVRSPSLLGEAAKLIANGEKTRGWAIKSARAHARRIQSIAEALGNTLPDATHVDDKFRAELLLGYVAGPPKGQATTEEEGEQQ